MVVAEGTAPVPSSPTIECTRTESEESGQGLTKDPYFSRAVSKSFEILRLLSSAAAPMPLHEIATAVDLTRSSAFRLLYTLEMLRQVYKDDSGRYSPLSSSTISTFSQRLLEAAAEPMRRLNIAFQETISLSILRENHVEVLAVLDSPRLVRMSNIVGRILPPHASSMGKAILAYLPAARRTQLLQAYGFTVFTEHTIVVERQLDEHFESIRYSGIAYDDEENTPDGFCMGVPIFWPDDQVQSALSLSMPKGRLPLDMEARQQFPLALQAAAREIATGLNTPRG